MASIIKRNGKYQVRVRLKNKKSESETFDSKAAAVKWATDRESELRDERRGDLPLCTVRAAITTYREEVAPKHRGWRWEDIRLQKILREIEFADYNLTDVRPADIMRWRDARLKEVSSASVRREYGILRAVFTDAKVRGFLHESPFTGMSPPDGHAPRSQRISDEEAVAICEKLGYERGTRPETASQFIAAAFLWCIATAMRQGEALSLDRSDVKGKVAHLAQTKNGSSRSVPLSNDAMELLSLLPEQGRLFPVASHTADVLFRRARNSTGLHDIHFHDSRREATTRMSKKVDALTLAKITGHKDLKILLETYYAPRMDEVAELLD
jgi:integrase